MSVKRPKIIVIVGPTSSGKSDLAVKIAKKVDGEIISADSRQVYIGMDIGTGKITKKEMKGIPHHLLDIVSPKKDFNISHFRKLATDKIQEVINRGKIPIIVGGTGFWIEHLLYDQPIPDVRPDQNLRAKLEGLSEDILFSRLQKLDPGRARTIDKKNKRRLVRALEIIASTKKPIPRVDLQKRKLNFDALIVGLNPPQKTLKKRICARLLKRLKAGMLKEIRKLHDSGISWKRLDNFGLEYRYGSRYLRGLISYDEMVKQLSSAICHYAKRQMTWFKRDREIKWYTS